MRSYILISTCERESTAQAFMTPQAAKEAMYDEFIRVVSKHVSDEELSEIVSEIEYDPDYTEENFGFHAGSAWYNDHFGQNLDWQIQEVEIPIPSDDSIANIRWVKDDILAGLCDEQIPFDDDFLEDCVIAVEENRYFRGAQIERGWDVIHQILHDEFDKLSQYEKDQILIKMWMDIEDAPMNPETETLEEDYSIFEKGTLKDEIWKYFDESYSQGVYKLLYKLDDEKKRLGVA